jgi:GMP synthase-like glutamine amidotransferase
MRPVAIFRFSPTEGPGHFGAWLERRDVPRRLIALDQGASVPAEARTFSGIGLMGGPMSANDELRWNEPLLALLRDAVASDIPIVGHCLGGQLFARALGARVAPTATPEIGWGEVTATDRAAPPWFGGRERFTTFQWHYDVFELPPGATRLLTNAFNPQQAYAFGKHIGFQCHIEMTRDMVETWCNSGAGELPPHSSGARQSRDDIFRDLDSRLAALSQVADDVYTHWALGLAR